MNIFVLMIAAGYAPFLFCFLLACALALTLVLIRRNKKRGGRR